MQIQTIDPAKTELNHHHQAEVAGHHEEHPDHRIFGLIVFLVAEGMIFLGMFGAYLAFRSVLPSWPPEGTPRLELLLPGVNTVLLISSSFVMHNADVAVKKNDVKGMQKWLAITAAMGAIFLVGQLYEYSHLEFTLTTNLFASAFYVLTGFSRIARIYRSYSNCRRIMEKSYCGTLQQRKALWRRSGGNLLALCRCRVDYFVWLVVLALSFFITRKKASNWGLF